MPLYRFALIGNVTAEQVKDVTDEIINIISDFELEIGADVEILTQPVDFKFQFKVASVVAFFGGKDKWDAFLEEVLQNSIPVVPIASSLEGVSEEMPELISPLNCLGYDKCGAQKVALTLLECAGLLPRQRRVFVSYKRKETIKLAQQLFSALSSRQYDVFLDTYDILSAANFQEELWHKLCDCDVLILLDSPTYFDSRWTVEEFGRAHAKNITILRVGLPNVLMSKRINTEFNIELTHAEYKKNKKQITDAALNRIASRLEAARSKSHAVRNRIMMDKIKLHMEAIGGELIGFGVQNTLSLRLPNQSILKIKTTVGVPTSTSLHDASNECQGEYTAVVFDHVGIKKDWLKHLAWLAEHIKHVQIIKIDESPWQFTCMQEA